ncbi:MAG TPA: hypothetical protein VGI17_01015 [Solirubrobacterales bacterium]|jgi:hypothetical protein
MIAFGGLVANWTELRGADEVGLSLPTNLLGFALFVYPAVWVIAAAITTGCFE